MSMDDLIVYAPDISPEDNAELAQAASDMARALVDVADLVGDGPALRRMVLRLFTKFAGEQLSAEEFEEIIKGRIED